MKTPYPDPALPPVVLVDDCEDDLFLARHLLREGGVTHPILALESVGEALAFLERLAANDAVPQLVFTDVRMAASGGLDLIAWARQRRCVERVRIAVLSGSNSPADVEHALAAGADGYVVKFPSAEVLADFVLTGPRVVLPHSIMDASAALSA